MSSDKTLEFGHRKVSRHPSPPNVPYPNRQEAPENRRNVRALRHARCEGHRRYYDVLPASAGSGKERVASGTVPLSVGSKHRNLRIAQESLAASLTWCVCGRFDAEARSPPTHTTDSQLTRCYVSRPSNIKPTMPPTCMKTSRQHNQSNEAKPTPPTVKENSPHDVARSSSILRKNVKDVPPRDCEGERQAARKPT